MSRKPKHTRRRLLTCAGIGLATGLAGCNTGPTPRRPDDTDYTSDATVTPPEGNTDDDEVIMPPEKACAYFHSEAAGEFSMWKLSTFSEPKEDLTRLYTTHPDSRVTDATVNGESARFDFSAKLQRDINCILYIRDDSGTFHTKSQTLAAPNGGLSFKDYTLTFDITDISLPINTGGFLELIVSDTHPGDNTKHILKRHQFVGVEHDNGVRWFNNTDFNIQNYRREDGRPMSSTPTNSDGVMATEDNGGGRRTVFLVARVNTNGEVFGVSTTVDKGFVSQYRQASRSWRKNHQHRWECHYATQVSHLRDLAEKTHDAITDLGLTNDLDRLNALADLIQKAVPYGTPIEEECPPIIVLHETLGDCSETSALIAGILANDPWNVRTGYIDCELGGGAHLTLGIDERDFDAGTADILWVEAENVGPRPANLPDTRYAFLEMTSDTNIGQTVIGITINGIYDTGTWEYQNHGSNTPPNY